MPGKTGIVLMVLSSICVCIGILIITASVIVIGSGKE
jgi:hypothetical protein